MRSDAVKKGIAQAPQRSLMRALGLTEEEMKEKVTIDMEMPFGCVTEGLVKELELLEPYGKGNTKPIFAQKDIRFSNCKVFGKNRNVVKMKAQDSFGFGAECIWFGDGDEFLERLKEKDVWDVIYYPSVNSFQGRESIEMIIQNIR